MTLQMYAVLQNAHNGRECASFSDTVICKCLDDHFESFWAILRDLEEVNLITFFPGPVFLWPKSTYIAQCVTRLGFSFLTAILRDSIIYLLRMLLKMGFFPKTIPKPKSQSILHLGYYLRVGFQCSYPERKKSLECSDSGILLKNWSQCFIDHVL